jgi:hypothetical protein
MQPIRVHRRTRLRIIIYDIALTLGCWLVAYFVVSASSYDALAKAICSGLAFVCSALYVWDIFVACRSSASFELVLTTSCLTCRSPNQRLCPDFSVELIDIETVTSDSDGGVKLMTSAGTQIDLSRAKNFGAPVKSFVEDIARLNPHIALEST